MTVAGGFTRHATTWGRWRAARPRRRVPAPTDAEIEDAIRDRR